MRGDRRLEQIAVTGRQRAVQIAAVGDNPRLVERHPLFHAAIELAEHDLRIFGKPVRDVGVEPAAAIIERCRQVPVIEREQRLDVVLEQLVDEAVVEIQSCGVHLAGARGQDAAPRNAEAVRLHSELSHQRNIFGPTAIVIARDVASVAIAHQSVRVHEAMPDARASAVSNRRAFDLICSGCTAPQKPIRKCCGAHRVPQTLLQRRGRTRFRSAQATLPYNNDRF